MQPRERVCLVRLTSELDLRVLLRSFYDIPESQEPTTPTPDLDPVHSDLQPRHGSYDINHQLEVTEFPVTFAILQIEPI